MALGNGGYYRVGGDSMPSTGTLPNGKSVSVPGGGSAGTRRGENNAVANPGNALGNSSPTLLWQKGDPGVAANRGSHGGSSPYASTNLILGYAVGGGGGAAGYNGGTAGTSWGVVGTSYPRTLGSSGGSATSFYTAAAIDGVQHAGTPSTYYGSNEWQQSPTYGGYVELSRVGDDLVDDDYLN